MSVALAIKAARAAGIELALDGADLALSAASAPPAAVLDALSRHKAEIVALLRPAEDSWSAEDWQAYFDERAGIVEFDGGLPREEAEAQAFECCVAEWLNRNPERSPAGYCLPMWRSWARPRSAAALRYRTDRPCLAAFALLASLARGPEGQGGRRPIADPGGRRFFLEPGIRAPRRQPPPRRGAGMTIHRPIRPRRAPSRVSSLRSVFENPPGSEVEVEGGMLVRRVSAFSGIEREVVLPITPEQLAAWRAGALIQRAMPHLTPDQREFIKTGVTPDEWTFGKGVL